MTAKKAFRIASLVLVSAAMLAACREEPTYAECAFALVCVLGAAASIAGEAAAGRRIRRTGGERNRFPFLRGL